MRKRLSKEQKDFIPEEPEMKDIITPGDGLGFRDLGIGKT
jgi:hypothetical protein